MAAQVALAVPLLVGAGLLLHTFLSLWNLLPGFDPNQLVTAHFSMQDARYRTAPEVTQLYDRVLDRLAATPGVESAAVTLTLPYERAVNTGFRLPGSVDFQYSDVNYATPDYFRVLRVPLIAGRVFAGSDTAQSEAVVVINQAFSDRYLGDQQAIGRILRLGSKPVEVIGIVGNIQSERAGWGDFGPIAHVPTMFIPLAQLDDQQMRLDHVFASPGFVI